MFYVLCFFHFLYIHFLYIHFLYIHFLYIHFLFFFFFFFFTFILFPYYDMFNFFVLVRREVVVWLVNCGDLVSDCNLFDHIFHLFRLFFSVQLFFCTVFDLIDIGNVVCVIRGRSWLILFLFF